MDSDTLIRPSSSARLQPIAATLGIAVVAWLIFREPPTEGFAIVWPLIAVILAILFTGYLIQAVTSPALLTISTTGLKPHWFIVEILWEQIRSVSLAQQQGFQIGGPFIQIHLTTPIEQPDPYPERFVGFEVTNAYTGNEFGNWWETRLAYPPI
jgi:hypothetical protein